MKRTHNSAIKSGRPYGGTGFIFNKEFSPFLHPVLQYEGERISVMKLLDSDCTIFLINVYFPFKQSGDEHRAEFLDLLGSIENIISSNPTAKFIITGDFNYNIYDLRAPISQTIVSFLNRHGLMSTHELDPSFSSNTSYTRCCVKSGTYSILDYIFISRSLRDRVRACTISYDGRNPSDHVPVSMEIEVAPLSTGDGSHVDIKNSRINWSSISHAQLVNYEQSMEFMLDSIHIPTGLIHGDKYCCSTTHFSQIEDYYLSVFSVLEKCDSLLPRKSSRGKKGKDFWTDSLSQLKQESVEAYEDWRSNGRPSSGAVFDRKKQCHYRYKAELRRQRRLTAGKKSDEMSDNLLNKNFSGFWKAWKKVAHAHEPPVNRIGDAVTEPAIAAAFKSYFQEIYGQNGTDAHGNLRRKFEERFPDYVMERIDESIIPYLLTWDDMISITGKLKEGKSTNSNITAEHILYGSPKLIVHLHLLFNAFIQHGFVPSNFLKGTISPTVKNSSGNLNSADNYRGITLCSVVSHLFENALRLKFGKYLISDELQFGFKPNHSTCHAVFTLKSCINYYTQRNSNVYVAFLDFSKAFDTISHCGLFLKLMDRKVPLCFLLTIMFWYTNMEYNIKWSNVHSESFPVECGTKQGGILSPDFFAIYINDLIIQLRSTGIGCHVIRRFIACLLFADDVSLICPSRGSLQRLLNICADYCLEFRLKFNIGKTKIMVFGKLSKSVHSISKIALYGEEIEYVSSCKYLGFHILSNTEFSVSVNEDLRGFFGSVNSILTSVRQPRENVMMQLLYSNCIPKLTYGAAVKDLNATEKHQYNVAVNNAIRRIFGFRLWQSIRQIREYYGYPSIELMFANAKTRFYQKLSGHDNSILRFLSTIVTHPVE